MSRAPLHYSNKYYNRSRELIHNVKKAKEEAFKTVERYAAQKVNCLNSGIPLATRGIILCRKKSA